MSARLEWLAREAVAIGAYESRQRFLRQSQAVDFPDAPYIGRDWSKLDRATREQWRDEVDNAHLDAAGAYITPPDEFRGS